MSRRPSRPSTSTAALLSDLQDILSSSEASDQSDDEDNVTTNDELESETNEDCEIIESTGNENRAPTSNSSTAAASLLSTRTASLLTILKAPRQSDLSRKRKVLVNPPPKGKRSSKRLNSKATIYIKPDQRVKEFPNEHLSVSNGKLFCEACREQLNLKKSSIINHTQSTKHKERKIKLQEKEKRDQTIVQALQKYNETHHLRGETLPLEHQAYRVKVLQAFLRAAVPLNKLDKFRSILEENAFRLTDRHCMSDHIPFILKEEQATIRRELADKYISVIFDGTTRLGEALAVVVRFISEDWTLEQRLIKMQMLAKSMKGEEIARELIHLLSTEYNIGPSYLVAAMRDRASVNDAAMRIVTVVYPNLLDVGCFAHTIDLVGEHFHTPSLSEFGMLWVSLFSHSPKVRMLWKDQTSLSMPSYSPTRWWSRWEVYRQLMVQFGDLEQFLRRNDDVAPTTRTKLLAFFSESSKKGNLQIELAAIVDYGEPFVKATYKLEGDGPLALECYEIVECLSTSVELAHAPNVEAVAQAVSHGSHTTKQRLLNHAKSCVQPAHSYYRRQLASSLKVPLKAFKAARLFSPTKVHVMEPTLSTVDALATFPFLKEKLSDLKHELPLYISKAADVSESFDCLKWWKTYTTDLPIWSSAAKQVLLVQPSSAASERVFSLLKASFKDQQDSSLQDYVETSLMLQYNKR